MRVVADSRLRPHGHWDRPTGMYLTLYVTLLNPMLKNCHTIYVLNPYLFHVFDSTYSSFMAQQLLVDQGSLVMEPKLPHSDTPHSVGLLWTSYRPVAETSI